MKSSKFRIWVQNIWMENCDECLTFLQKPATLQQYWSRYKYWLKREYRHQQRSDRDKI
jgi:hypothetical protein